MYVYGYIYIYIYSCLYLHMCVCLERETGKFVGFYLSYTGALARVAIGFEGSGFLRSWFGARHTSAKTWEPETTRLPRPPCMSLLGAHIFVTVD